MFADAGEVVSRRVFGRGVTFLPATPKPPGLALFPWECGEGLNDARTKLADVFQQPANRGAAVSDNGR